MQIFLIGFMGSGKTSFGKRLSKQLNLKFYDLDNEIEKKYKATIPTFFEVFGENIFRNLETAVLKEIISRDKDFVLSCGGGTPCFNENMKLINESGISIYVNMNVNALCSRLKNAKKKRPLLTGLSEDTLFEKVSTLLAEREQFYNKANYVIDGLNINIAGIISKLNNGKKNDF